ncbi:hypothetical protein GCM10009682_19740 [Luedemannella flava]|uniref:Uncharacterized protein n=1 Tax=Luedemannella flava TaxID=349316 RepID=A0ABN2LSF8_9ACTN
MSSVRPQAQLAARYRRLLFVYPNAYRRDRGEEIVGTLLDMAPADRRRPTAREAVNLVTHGMRARLGRPASRWVVVWALAAAVICGLFAAAGGTRVAWALADRDEPESIINSFWSDGVNGVALTIFDGEPLRQGHITNLVVNDAANASRSYPAPAPQEQILATTRERLSAAGWTVRPSTPDTGARIVAERGDVILELLAETPDGPAGTYLVMAVTRTTPWTVYPAGLVAGLLGALVGWLVLGWASRRTEHRHLALRMATSLLFGVTLVMWWLPAAWQFAGRIEHHATERHLRWHPMWEWVGWPIFTLFFYAGAMTALLALTLAAIPHRHRAAEVATS